MWFLRITLFISLLFMSLYLRAETPTKKVAIFCERGFPYYISPVSVRPEIIADALKTCGIQTEVVSGSEIASKSRFNSDRYQILVYVYGNTFPYLAYENLRNFHGNGGSFVFVGGAPFTHPCIKEGDIWVDVMDKFGSEFYSHNKIGSVGVEQVAHPEGFFYFKQNDPIGLGNFQWESLPNIGIVQYPVSSTDLNDEFLGIVGVIKDGILKGYPFAIVKHNCNDFKGAIDVWLGCNLLALLPEDFIYQITIKSVAFILKEKKLVSDQEFNSIISRAEKYFPTYAEIKQRIKRNYWLPRSLPPAKEIFVLDISGSPQDEQLLAVSMQGIINRRKPRIYLISSIQDQKWLEVISRKGYVVRKEKNIWKLLKRFEKEIKGAVIYDPNMPDTINIATMVSSVKSAVIVSPWIEERLRFPIIDDLRNRFSNRMEAYEWAFRSLWPQLNHSVLAIMHPSWVFPRDYLIEFKVFTFWLDGIANCWIPPEDILFLKKLLVLTPPHIPILGWWQNGEGEGSGIGESTGVMFSSKYGKVTVATALCANLSLHSGVEVNSPLHQQPAQEFGEVEPKVYISFLLSDGDNFGANLYWVIKSKYDQKERGEVPMGWAFCPTQLELTPGVVEYFYSNATPNDYFLSADGIGYIWPNYYGRNFRYPLNLYREFLNLSKKYMQKVSHNQLWILQGDGVKEEVAKVLKPAALFNEWFPSPVGETSRMFQWDSNKCLFFWPITHPWMGWRADAFKKPESYVKEIRSSTPHTRPAFLVSAVNGFSIGPREVKKIMEMLGEDYIAVRPDMLVKLYSKWLEEGVIIREDRGNLDREWYTSPGGTCWVKKLIDLKKLGDLKDFKKAEIYALVKGRKNQCVKFLVNGKEYTYLLRSDDWEFATFTVDIGNLGLGINEICYTGNPFATLFTAGDSSICFKHSFYQGDDGVWRDLEGELICFIKLLRQ